MLSGADDQVDVAIRVLPSCFYRLHVAVQSPGLDARVEPQGLQRLSHATADIKNSLCVRRHRREGMAWMRRIEGKRKFPTVIL